MSRSKGTGRQVKPTVKPVVSAARPVTPQPAPHQQQTIVQQQAKFHQGPIPSGEELRIYEQTVPGAANRIIQMAEHQAQHRHGLENASLNSDSVAREKQLDIEDRRIKGIIGNERMGQLFGWSVAVCCVCFAGFSALRDASPITVGLFLSLPVMGVIKAFINGRALPQQPPEKA